MAYKEMGVLAGVRNKFVLHNHKLRKICTFSHTADIDECFEAAVIAVDICLNDTNTRCVNTEGSFDCVCVAGYHRVDGSCQR